MSQGLRTWSNHPIFLFQTGMLRGNRGFKGPQTGSLRGILVCRGSISGLLRSKPVCRGQNVGLLWSKPVCRTFLRVSLRSIRPWRRFLGQSLVSFWDRSPRARSVTLTRRGSLAPTFSRSCVARWGSPPIAASPSRPRHRGWIRRVLGPSSLGLGCWSAPVFKGRGVAAVGLAGQAHPARCVPPDAD